MICLVSTASWLVGTCPLMTKTPAALSIDEHTFTRLPLKTAWPHSIEPPKGPLPVGFKTNCSAAVFASVAKYAFVSAAVGLVGNLPAATMNIGEPSPADP